MTAPILRTKRETKPLLRRLLRLERQGRYAEALAEFGDDWRDDAYLPRVDEFEPVLATSLLIRFGCLIGYAGHVESIPGSQERSRDLLMDARLRAFAIPDHEMAAACENGLALTYWRTGEYREAEVWLGEALARELPPSCDERLFSHVISMLVRGNQQRNERNVEYASLVEGDFILNGDPFLVGNLHSNLGLSFKNLGRPDKALHHLTIARDQFRLARHWTYFSAVENNLALLYKNVGNFAAAHAAADSALARHKKLKDRIREGSTLETKAQIFLAEGRSEGALAAVEHAIKILRKGENNAYLAEAIATKAKIFAACANFADALLTLSEAIDITRIHSGEPAARKLIKEFEPLLSPRPKGERPETSAGGMEIVLTHPLAYDRQYRGVWVQNSFLEEIGVGHGTLALVEPGIPKRGQPVALAVNKTNEVVCGFYDAEFGIIGIDGGGHEPMLFPDDEVTVVGKIVAVCRKERGGAGKMIAEPISSHR